MIKDDSLARAALENIDRILSMQNRNPKSGTYGCFDRNYWHYCIVDTPSARMQEAALSLAHAYLLKHEDNPYYNNRNVLAWAAAGLKYWTEMQESNGSFNEWYPKEHSFVATAFSLYAMTETCLLLKKHIIIDGKLMKAITKAADWLCMHEETRVQNQFSGAIIALYNCYLLTKNRKYEQDAKKKLMTLKKLQDEEGWFMEYGGADIGYLSLAIDYLAKYYRKTGNKTALDMALKAVEFIQYALHPDGTAGGPYGSRNTEYLIPHGFEILAKEKPVATAVASFIEKSTADGKLISPSSLDERYLCYIGYTWLQAYAESRASGDAAYAKLPFQSVQKRFFTNSGILVLSTEKHYMVSNLYKGGAFVIVNKKTLEARTDSGISVITKEGKRCTSAVIDRNVGIRHGKDFVEMEGKLSLIKENIMTPLKSQGLRAFQYTLGRSGKVSRFVKEKLRDMLITSSSKTAISFRRRISFQDGSITVHDEAFPQKKIAEFSTGQKESYIYVPSSRYATKHDLEAEQITKKTEAKMKRVIR